MMDIDPVISHYNRCAQHVEDDARAMGWSSAFNQKLRFDVINHMVDLDDCSILDVGCGDGALFHYLKNNNMSTEYKGIDVSPNMIQRAQARYPGISVRECNFFNYTGEHDVVVCSGGLSMGGGDDPLVFLDKALNYLMNLSHDHVIINLLSDHAEKKDPMFHYYSPQDVMALCFKKTPYVTMNHGYLPHDFTVHLVRYSLFD
jgi:SAM-dependent methyltransferase